MAVDSLKEQLDVLWSDLKGNLFVDERDVKRGYFALVQFVTLVSEEKSRCLEMIRTGTKFDVDFEQRVRSLVLKGMAQNEREKMLLLAQPVEVRLATVRLQELNHYLESARQVESILRGILDCIRVELKLSYEGHK